MSSEFQHLQTKAQNEWDALQNPDKPIIFIGSATCGRSAGALNAKEIIQKELKTCAIPYELYEVGCIGSCYAEPIIMVKKPNHAMIIYKQVTPKRALEIVEQAIVGDNPLPEYALGYFGDESRTDMLPFFETSVLQAQTSRVLRRCGFIDPINLHHYIATGGYSGLHKALDQTPEQVLDEIQRSGLRGRGGAGFPTWRKWKFCMDTPDSPKYLICNADEGDPGAFMNRSLLEGDPHALLEGMCIAGYTLGAHEGYIYCRAEYPLALERLANAIQDAESHNLLGGNILQYGFNFNIKLKEGAGAFVCGEETALIASIEGERGMPRPRPPFPAVSGLWKKPTVINNVETLASVAYILQHGADQYTEYGTDKSKGTKTFALAGKVKNTGLIEVPLGTTLREVIFNIGGGPLEDKEFKAVQTGGPSGGCIPNSLIDTPIDYEALAEVGSIMGSGGIVVMDEDTCMVDIAAYFLNFVQKESCGKCVPCRVGTRQMLNILERITSGEGQPDDLDRLLLLAAYVKNGSLCGLGQTAGNPVQTTIRYFRHEYEAHIHEKRCPAKVCKPLIRYDIDESLCTGCQACKRICPTNAITGEKKSPHLINQALCIQCGSCLDVCPVKPKKAVALDSPGIKKEVPA
jgi:NADH-quinone oxidoreductase subunit F